MTQKECSRCKNDLQCNTEDISSCACNQLVISPRTKDFLKKTNYDCLCNSCLSELNETFQQIDEEDALADLEEGKHYYIESAYVVFTEYFHISRGYCCKSNCRHCAYGYKPESKLPNI
ncbi:MAG: hypothetical protein ACI9QR_001484 [Flavobacteriaceae bacterium]|jgi:hypothetical protein